MVIVNEKQALLNACGVSKTYTLWHRPIDRLTAPAWRGVGERTGWCPPLSRWAEARATRLARPFPALQPLNFQVRRGESVGIIGRNGSGKSTLLQILAGTLTPTTGSVEKNGRLAALLELGSGFNPEFSGRENVFLQAAIYGVSAADMSRHFEAVAAFAEIGEFIDQPVKTYSTGMLVRLAFSVQVVLKPDVLIIDEALAVGDVFFQAKCSAYFRERLAEGMSLIFVSHDLVTVKALCQRAVVLQRGVVQFEGESKEAVSIYHSLHSAENRQAVISSSGAPSRSPKTRNWTSTDEIGTREAEFVSCEVLDAHGQSRRAFGEMESIRIRLAVRAHTSVPILHAAFQIVDRHNRALYGVSTVHQEFEGLSLDANAEATLEIDVPGRLGPGEYLIDAALGWGNRGDGAFTHQCHRVGGIASISVGRVTPNARFLGPVDLGATMAWK